MAQVVMLEVCQVWVVCPAQVDQVDSLELVDSPELVDQAMLVIMMTAQRLRKLIKRMVLTIYCLTVSGFY